MGLLGAPSRTGGYTDPGSPTQNIPEGKNTNDLANDLKSAVYAPFVKADQVRGVAFDLPILVFSLAVLYDKAFIQGDSDASWQVGDALAIIIASWLVKRAGVARRWGVA